MNLIKSKLGLIKIFSVALFLIFSGHVFYTRNIDNSDEIEITKNEIYKGKDLETVFYITCFRSRKKETRYFEVIKTDMRLKNQFMSEYLLIEKRNPNNVLYYPSGWLSGSTSESDIKYNCQEIIRGNTKAVIPY